MPRVDNTEKQVHVKLPADVHKALWMRAAEEERSINTTVVRALRAYLGLKQPGKGDA